MEELTTILENGSHSVLEKTKAILLENSFVQMDGNSPIMIAVVGILFCFFGLKMVRVWAALFGFTLGTILGAQGANYFSLDNRWSVIASILMGLIVASVSAWFYWVSILLVGWALGMSVSSYFLQPNDWIQGLICVGIGLVVALIAIKIAEPMTMLLTALFGGIMIGRAVSIFLPLEKQLVYFILTIVCVVLGVVVQLLFESKKRKKSHLRKAEEIKNQYSVEKDVESARAMMEEVEENKE